MARDHYIPQCLTRPWHDPSLGKESLRFFDFETKTFGHKNSRKLFACRGLNSTATEEYLNRYIETPFANVQDRIAATDLHLERVEAETNKLPHTALVGLYWLQVQRISDANGRDTGQHLDEFARRGIAWLEEFTAAVFAKWDAMIYGVPNPMCFPSTGIFPIPLADQRPAMALPIHPMLALVFIDKDANREILDGWMREDLCATMLSMALTAKRIVLPPGMDLDAQTVLGTRAKMRQVFELVSEMGHTSGLTSWQLADP